MDFFCAESDPEDHDCATGDWTSSRSCNPQMTIFHRIVSSEEKSYPLNPGSSECISDLVDGIIDQISTQKNDAEEIEASNTVSTGHGTHERGEEESYDSFGFITSTVNGITDHDLIEENIGEKIEISKTEKDSKTEAEDTFSEDSSPDIVQKRQRKADVRKERKRQRKPDVRKERKKIGKLFGVVCPESEPEKEDPVELGAKTEQLYLEQCCSWFKRTTRGGNKNRRLIDDFVTEELPRSERKPTKRRKQEVH